MGLALALGGCDTVDDEGLVFEAPILEPDLLVTPLTVVIERTQVAGDRRIRITATNVGDADLRVTSVSVEGSPAFRLQNVATAFVLRPEEQVDLVVAYQPDVPEVQTATLRIASDDPDEPLVEVELLGEGTNLISSDISEPRTLTNTAAPADHPDYVVRGLLSVSAALTIEAGVHLAFLPGSGLLVEETGSLTAEGGTADRIVLAGTTPSPGHWRGVLLASPSGANTLAEVDIVHAGGRSQATPLAEAAMLVRSGARVAMRGVRLLGSGSDGLVLEPGAVVPEFEEVFSTGHRLAPVRIPASLAGILSGGVSVADEMPAGIAPAESAGPVYVEVVADEVRAAATWPRLAVPYRVQGVVDVHAPLRLDPGSRVRFGPDAGIRVQAAGSLAAIGDEDARIELYGAQPTPGYWRGVLVTSNDDANALRGVEIRHAGGRPHVGQRRAAAVVVEADARLRMDHASVDGYDRLGLLVEGGGRLDTLRHVRFGVREAPAAELPASLLGHVDVSTEFAEGAYVVAGAQPVTRPQYWTLQVPVHFTGITRFEAQVRLAAGFHGVFRAPAGWTVGADGGSIAAEGTAEAPVVLDAWVATPGYWRGLRIQSNDRRNVLRHTTVAHAGGQPFESGGPSANVLVDTGARLALDHVTLTRSGGLGLVVDPGGTLTAFRTNALVANAGAPARLPVDMLGALDATSRFARDNGRSYIEVVGGRVEAEATWPSLDVAYRFGDPMTFIQRPLTIEAGATLLFGPDAGLRVRPTGALTAIGTADAPIRFTADIAASAGGALPGYWRGLLIESASPRNVLAHTVVEYGGGLLFGDTVAEANLYVENGGRLNYRDSVNRFSEDWGLFVEDGAVVEVSGITYDGNPEGDARVPGADGPGS